MREIYFIRDSYEDHLPVTQRAASFVSFFSKLGWRVETETLRGASWNQILSRSVEGKKFIFISMPPFRNFRVFFTPRVQVVLDIRDGWSIAMESGYGGTSRQKKIKAKFARLIERYMMRRAWIVSTCTPGLQEYLSQIAKRNVLLIPNGIDQAAYNAIREGEIIGSGAAESAEQLIFCCAGKFSEYGEIKVKKLFEVLLHRYPDKKLLIEIIGCNEEKNRWAIEYMRKISDGRAIVTIWPKMSRVELLKKMSSANYGVSIIRDPAYEFGTKIYDYIALGLPVVNYFDKPNNFTNYFDACLDRPFNKDAKYPEIRRDVLIETVLRPYIEVIPK